MSVSPEQRHKRLNPCPICGGGDDDHRRQGIRCAGFTSMDGEWARCQQVTSPWIDEKTAPAIYVHKVHGDCDCGSEHKPAKPGQDSTGAKREQIPWRTVAEYVYFSADGDPLFKVVRREAPNPDGGKPLKTFPQYRYVGSGQWVKGLGDVKRVLYLLPELRKADPAQPVYIVEGEKCADYLAVAGCVVTTASGGALKWHLTRTAREALRGRHVVILPDNDGPNAEKPQEAYVGQRHAKHVADDLEGIAASVRVLELPGLLLTGDVVDWLAGGGTKEQLLALARRAPLGANWTPPTGARTDSPKAPWKPEVQSAVDLMRKELPPVRWAVHGIIPEGVTLLAAKPKKGKSALMMHVAMCVASSATACGYFETEQSEVLYLAMEDNERRMQRRMRQMLQGEDPPKGFHITTKWLPLDRGGLGALQTYLDEHPAIHMIVADTLEHIRPKRHANGGYGDDYASVDGLRQIAGERQIAVVAITHLRKAPADDPFDEINATMGLMASVDNAIVLRPNSGILELHRRGRDFEDETVLALKGDAKTLLWRVEGKAEEVTRSAERKEIIEALRADAKRKRAAKKAADGMTPKAIAVALGKNDVTIRRLLQKMLGELNPPIRQDDAGRYHAMDDGAPDPVHAFTPEDDGVNGHQAASDQAPDDVRSHRSQRSQQSDMWDSAHPAEPNPRDGVNTMNGVNDRNAVNDDWGGVT